jgi:hypothetical protein
MGTDGQRTSTVTRSMPAKMANLCLFKPVSIQTLTHELSKIETGYSSPVQSGI